MNNEGKTTFWNLRFEIYQEREQLGNLYSNQSLKSSSIQYSAVESYKRNLVLKETNSVLKFLMARYLNLDLT